MIIGLWPIADVMKKKEGTISSDSVVMHEEMRKKEPDKAMSRVLLVSDKQTMHEGEVKDKGGSDRNVSAYECGCSDKQLGSSEMWSRHVKRHFDEVMVEVQTSAVDVNKGSKEVTACTSSKVNSVRYDDPMYVSRCCCSSS